MGCTARLSLVIEAIMQCTRDEESPYFCINLDNNMDNEFYCASIQNKLTTSANASFHEGRVQ